MIELPPVEADVLGLVDRTDQQPDPNRQELHFRERHFDIARHDEPFVEHSIKDFDQPRGSSVRLWQLRHKQRILRRLVNDTMSGHSARTR